MNFFANAGSMFVYHVKHALRSVSRNPLFTFVMELSLGFGVALWTVARTGTAAQANVTLEFPEHIYHLEINRDVLVRTPHEVGRSDFWNSIADYLLSYRDAIAIAEASGVRHTLSFSSPILLESEGSEPQSRTVRFTTAPLFDMFERRFIAGHTWSAEDDASAAAVCVLTRTQAAANNLTIGSAIRIGAQPYTVVGIVDDDRSERRFYDYTAYPDTDAAYVPLSTVRRVRARPVNYYPWGDTSPDYESIVSGEMGFLHAFVELPSAQARNTYERFLDAYVEAQRATPRTPRLLRANLRPLEEWAILLTASPFVLFQFFGLLGFIACIFNLVRLLISKFSARASEVAIRRALGAPKRSIFIQHLIEAEIVAIGGTVLGLLLAVLGLSMLNTLLPDRPVDFTLDAQRAALATIGAFVAGLVAGFYPALRICNVPPATVLRRQ